MNSPFLVAVLAPATLPTEDLTTRRQSCTRLGADHVGQRSMSLRPRALGGALLEFQASQASAARRAGSLQVPPPTCILANPASPIHRSPPNVVAMDEAEGAAFSRGASLGHGAGTHLGDAVRRGSCEFAVRVLAVVAWAQRNLGRPQSRVFPTCHEKIVGMESTSAKSSVSQHGVSHVGRALDRPSPSRSCFPAQSRVPHAAVRASRPLWLINFGFWCHHGSHGTALECPPRPWSATTQYHWTSAGKPTWRPKQLPFMIQQTRIASLFLDAARPDGARPVLWRRPQRTKLAATVRSWRSSKEELGKLSLQLAVTTRAGASPCNSQGCRDRSGNPS